MQAFLFAIFKEIKIKNILMLTITGIINAIGVTVFISPVKLYDSGISGTSILLSQLTPDYLSLSLFLILLNIPLFYTAQKSRADCLPLTLYTPLAYIR